MSNTIDSRAFTSDELKVFEEGGLLHPFIELVKKHEDELQLCFRGNTNPKSISIYFNNRQVYKVTLNGSVKISYRTARYWNKCKDDYKKLTEQYHFEGPETFKDFLKKKDYTLKKKVERSDDYEKIYSTILKPILDNYFSNNDTYDYFKDAKGRSHPESEKKAQQKLFNRFKELKSGYFFYDLEFHQTKNEKKGISNENVSKNEPDMLGIYFDKNRIPQKLVFVEIKSKKDSIGKLDDKKGSGVRGHLNKISAYIENKAILENRRKEACALLNNYAQLGLRGLSANMQFDYKYFENIKVQALFLFTDEVINYMENHLDDFKCFEGKAIKVAGNDCTAYAFDEDALNEVLREDCLFIP